MSTKIARRFGVDRVFALLVGYNTVAFIARAAAEAATAWTVVKHLWAAVRVRCTRRAHRRKVVA